MKKAGILNSDISRVLSYMGHTDTIAQQPDLLGATAVENAVTLINGGSIEKVIPVEVTLITAENVG